MEKIYTAFVSSVSTLTQKRKNVYDALLDLQVLPIGMEHFAVASGTENSESEIKMLIDASDFFILLLGRDYGSIIEEREISYTAFEYEYAVEKKKKIFVISCYEFQKLLGENVEKLTDDEKKQRDFGLTIVARTAENRSESVQTLVTRFIGIQKNNVNSSNIGWKRVRDDAADEETWKEEHECFNISGTWYHVHLSDIDENYIRIGTITIQQNFQQKEYQEIIMSGNNYDVSFYDSSRNCLVEIPETLTTFTGEYKLQDTGNITGIFSSEVRSEDRKFRSRRIARGGYRGIHDFRLKTNKPKEKPTSIEGNFYDVAPSSKQGWIFLFREEADRDACVMEKRKSIIEER